MLRKNRKKNIWIKVLLVISAISLTTVGKYLLERSLGQGPPLLLYLPAVILCSYVGGFWSGVSATILSGISSSYFFLEPKFSFTIASENDLFRLVVFAFVSLVISFLFERLHAHEFEIETANTELAQRKRELETIANKLAGSNAELEITARELKRSNEELERFASVASHDLQQPLRMVSSYLSLIEKKLGSSLDRDAVEFMGYAKEGAQRMSRLVTDLLRYSRLGNESVALVPTDGEEVLRLVLLNLHPLIQETGAVIHHENLPPLVSNPLLLEELFQNLISNGIKYHGPSRPEITVDAKLAGTEWIFSVHDNGVGIAAADQDRIFDMFRRLHGREIEGSGIGLATCKKILERLGGRIWVESQPGRGSTFYFSLPDAAPGKQTVKLCG